MQNSSECDITKYHRNLCCRQRIFPRKKYFMTCLKKISMCCGDKKYAILTENAHLFLREMTPDDFRFSVTMLQDPNVMYAWEKIFSDAEVRAWIERILFVINNSDTVTGSLLKEKQANLSGKSDLFLKKSGETAYGSAGFYVESMEERICNGKAQDLAQSRFSTSEGLTESLRISPVQRDIHSGCGTSQYVFLRRYDKFVDEKTMPHRLICQNHSYHHGFSRTNGWFDFQKLKKLLNLFWNVSEATGTCRSTSFQNCRQNQSLMQI